MHVEDLIIKAHFLAAVNFRLSDSPSLVRH